MTKTSQAQPRPTHKKLKKNPITYTPKKKKKTCNKAQPS